MGPSGCGKSTLAKLLQGFYQPTEGRSASTAATSATWPPTNCARTFGVVPQETVLFAGTLSTTTWSWPTRMPASRMSSTPASGRDPRGHRALPEGYQTEIGERGIGLSGGQRQRIAIARALLKRPKILIFDEAVSNLDQQTAEHFAKTINKLKGKVTMLFITHQITPTSNEGLQVDEVLK
jgi:subfamily B ATP-binding cassette protein HlyB/CyaB